MRNQFTPGPQTTCEQCERLQQINTELLEALQMIVEEYQSVLEKYNKLIAPEFMDYQTLSEAVAIIAKATGEKEEVK